MSSSKGFFLDTRHPTRHASLILGAWRSGSASRLVNSNETCAHFFMASSANRTEAVSFRNVRRRARSACIITIIRNMPEMLRRMRELEKEVQELKAKCGGPNP
jgi:hypothetical protein